MKPLCNPRAGSKCSKSRLTASLGSYTKRLVVGIAATVEAVLLLTVSSEWHKAARQFAVGALADRP